MHYGITNDDIFGATMAALNAGQPQGIIYSAIYNKALQDIAHAAACLEIVPTARGRIPEKSSMEWMRRQLEDPWNKAFTKRKLEEMAAIRASGVLDTREVRKVGE